MPQLFPRSANNIAKASIAAVVFLLAAATFVLAALNRSDYYFKQSEDRPQPVQFSHKHHVGDEGFDCRYCHQSVEYAASAGIPPTKTCMNCHTQIWADSPYLEPVRESWRTGKPIEWTRVHNLPGYAYFNHSIHVNKGVGCSTCHGRIDLMPLVYQQSTLQMGWCLRCHREPERFLRDKKQIYNMEWRPENTTAGEIKEGLKWKEEYQVKNARILTSCSTCHR
jgi:hypothetical protein